MRLLVCPFYYVFYDFCFSKKRMKKSLYFVKSENSL